MTDKRIGTLKAKLQRSRSRIINIQPDLADILRNAVYVADDGVYRISTNGTCIYFDPAWIQRLNDEETDFILAHQVMHILLGHIERPLYFKSERYHLACDIIVNSYLRRSGWEYDQLSHIGSIYYQTFFPKEDGYLFTPEEAMKKVPFDPALKSGSKRRFVIDSDIRWDDREDEGESGTVILRPGEEDPFDTGKITKNKNSILRYIRYENSSAVSDITDENKPDTEEDDDYYIDYDALSTWDKRSADAIKSLQQTMAEETSDDEADEQTRSWRRLRRSRLDWRELLNVFVREELCDYSFTPPDRRFQEGGFFLPDYNVPDEKTRYILFMADTSASISDKILSIVYSELCSALDQFGDKLEGVLAFFDSRVYSPAAFSSIDDLKNIKPEGGGVTDFRCIFDFLKNKLAGDLPLSIVIFTDGKGEFPPEDSALNVPVLWMITNTHSLPPWGKFVVVEK